MHHDKVMAPDREGLSGEGTFHKDKVMASDREGLSGEHRSRERGRAGSQRKASCDGENGKVERG